MREDWLRCKSQGSRFKASTRRDGYIAEGNHARSFARVQVARFRVQGVHPEKQDIAGGNHARRLRQGAGCPMPVAGYPPRENVYVRGGNHAHGSRFKGPFVDRSHLRLQAKDTPSVSVQEMNHASSTPVDREMTT